MTKGSQRLPLDIRARSCWIRTAGLLFSLMIMICLAPAIHAKTFVVGVDYQTIGDALRVAEDGDLVEVKGGEHRERLMIHKAIHLKGIDNPILIAGKGHMVEISSPEVIFEGFTIKYENPADLERSDTAIFLTKGSDKTIIKNNRLLNVMFGIWSVESKNLTIENNILKGIKEINVSNRGNCINLTGSHGTKVTGNTLSNCRDGIYIEISHDTRIIGNSIKNSRYAIHTMWVDRGKFNKNTAIGNLVGPAIMYSKRSEINDNLAAGNKTHGLLLIQTVRCKINGNTVIGNTKGIFLYNSIYNEVLSNLVVNNHLGFHNWGGSEDNKITMNSFINNEIQVKYVETRKNQEWDNNYWSDYIGWDMTEDGVGDSPYESNTVVDHLFWRYPLSKVLFTSPSLHLLWMLEKQFPLLKVPRVIDKKPSMLPLHEKWKELVAKYPFKPAKYYGEIKKLPHMPGGGS